MQTISKSRLKAHMLRIFREIEESGEDIIVTGSKSPGSSHPAYCVQTER